jgi:hypothetical protein
MGQLSEPEIFSCLSENFRLAAEDCEKLARSPRKGPTYAALRDKLELLEGACRQASVWRQDTRWLTIGLYMAKAHEISLEWLRGIKAGPGQPRIKVAAGHMHPLFVKLAENLREAHAKAEEFRTKATGKIGTILPETQRAPLRDTTPVGWRRQSGLIVPAGATVQ